MLIPIKRIYLSSGVESEVLLNTNYIIKIEDAEDPSKPKTRIVFQDFDEDGKGIMYTNYTVSYIKGLLTKARNKDQEREE